MLDQPHRLLICFCFEKVVDQYTEHACLVWNVNLYIGINVEVVPGIAVQRDYNKSLFCHCPVDAKTAGDYSLCILCAEPTIIGPSIAHILVVPKLLDWIRSVGGQDTVLNRECCEGMRESVVVASIDSQSGEVNTWDELTPKLDTV